MGSYRSNIIEEILSKVSQEEKDVLDKNIKENVALLNELENNGYEWNTDRSYSLELLKDHGHHPIAITTIICEETFIFETKEECDRAHQEMQVEKGLVDGWWYDKVEFEETYKNLGHSPRIYWLNKNK